MCGQLSGVTASQDGYSSLSSHEPGDKATDWRTLVRLCLICLSEAQNISDPLAAPHNLELDPVWFSQ